MSLLTAAYAAKRGIPYVALGPLTWWESVLRWPWSLAHKLSGTANPSVVMLALFAIYWATAFLILRYLIAMPLLRNQAK